MKHEGRDPRLLWHETTRRWVMAVYDEGGGKRSIAFYSSADLKAWTYESQIEGFYECPDLFELPVDGDPGRKLWVLSAADGAYLLGRFDGHKFEPEPGGKHRTWHGRFYAAQTFSDEPKGRRVQVGWAQGIDFPGIPFNQQMNVPCELTLRRTEEGVRMFARPVAELDSLKTRSWSWHDVRPGADPLSEVPGDLIDLRIEAEVGESGGFEITVPGSKVGFDPSKGGALSAGGIRVPMTPDKGLVKLRVLVDRRSVEVFGNDGRVAISEARGKHDSRQSPGLAVRGAGTKVSWLEVLELGSAWVPARP